MCRDHHSLNGYLILGDPPYFLELHRYIISSHSIWSYYLHFPICHIQHNMRPCLKKSTLPHIVVGVFVTDVAHKRCCVGQRNGRRKFQSRKRRRKTKFMTRMIIISFKKKLESLFQGRTWYWKDWMSWIQYLRADSMNSWTNDISLKIRVVCRWAKRCGGMTLEVSWMEDNIADLEVVKINKIK